MNDRPTCKHLVPVFRQGKLGLGCGFNPGDPVPVTAAHCAGCPDNQPKGVQYPVTVRSVELDPPSIGRKDDVGKLVRVVPVDDGTERLGIFLGTHPLFMSGSYDRERGAMAVRTTNNPLIFVPETGRLVYGAESWWEFVEGDAVPVPIQFARNKSGAWTTRTAPDGEAKGGADAK